MPHICCRIYDTRNHVPYLLPYIWYTESCAIFVALYMIYGIMWHICCPIYDTRNHVPYLLPYIWYMESCAIFVALYMIHGIMRHTCCPVMIHGIMRHICCPIYDTWNHAPYLLPYIRYIFCHLFNSFLNICSLFFEVSLVVCIFSWVKNVIRDWWDKPLPGFKPFHCKIFNIFWVQNYFMSFFKNFTEWFYMIVKY